MVVKFCTTNKKYNSTAIPEFTRELSCILKEGCSIINPTIRIDRQAINTFEYNYAFISDFHRYYWVRDVRYNGAVIYVDLVIDVLASYKHTIGEKDLYIVRSSSESDGYIPDNLYPVTNEVSTHGELLHTFNLDAGIAGRIIVGIIGHGGIKYYAMNSLAFNDFMAEILSSDFTEATVGSLMATVNQNLKLMVDPLQYISNIYLVPIQPDGANITSIHVGYATVTMSGTCQLISNRIVSTTINLSGHLQQHPQASDRGEYLNGASYTECSLTTPFGIFPLDMIELNKASNPQLTIEIDTFTGAGKIFITSNQGNSDNVILLDATGKLAVEIPVSQIISGGMDFGSTVMSIATNGATGNLIGAIGGTAGAIGSATANSVPKARSTGSVGSVVEIRRGIYLNYTWKYVADDFNADRGRPLCAVRKPKNIPGYIMASDPDVSISGTREEAEMINGFLSAGMFYE